MAVRSRVEVFERDFIFKPGNALGPEAISGAFAAFARSIIADVAGHNERTLGRPTPYEVTVDGVRGAPLESVRPTGVILAEYDLGSGVVEWVWEQIRQHAPVLTGRFRDSQVIFADGESVESPAGVAATASEIVILSTVPYARKIEGGGRRKPQSAKAPEGVYEVVAAMAQARFGNLARVRFGFRAFVGGGIMNDVPVARPSKRRNRPGSSKAVRAKAAQERANRQPAVIITFR